MTGPENIPLQAHGLAYAYSAGHLVFDDISLQVRPREIVCLLGASGCGKSTLLRVLARLETPTHGEIRFMGLPLTQPHPGTALLFQRPSLLPWLNVVGNVAFGLDFKHQPHIDRTERSERISRALEGVGLSGHDRDYPAQLSGGMAQRVALARALAHQPQLLFADEPFSALDAITRAEMQSLLLDVTQRWNTAVLLVTHDIDEALALGDRVLLMGGRPCRIVGEWTVDAERPREADTEYLTRLHVEILAALKALRTDMQSSINLTTEFEHERNDSVAG